MGWFSKFLGTDKALDVANNAIDKISGGLDQIIFTEEEKSEHALKVFEFWLETQKTVANESTVRSITRRIIAVAITLNFLFALDLAIVFFAMGLDTKAMKVIECLKLIDSAFAAVVLFYLGYYGATRIVEAVTGGNNK